MVKIPRSKIKVRGLKAVIRNLKKVDAKIKGPVRKKMLSEIGKKTKGFIQRHITSQAGEVTGNLVKSTHYRVFKDRVSVWNDAGVYAKSWNTGMKPHWIHRSMVSEAGYSVGDWMDAQGDRFEGTDFVYVGTGKIGRGIKFMEVGTEKIKKALPPILKKYGKQMVR